MCLTAIYAYILCICVYIGRYLMIDGDTNGEGRENQLTVNKQEGNVKSEA